LIGSLILRKLEVGITNGEELTMPTNHLYGTLLRQVQQLRPGERQSRTRTWTWFLTGLYLSRSVHLSKIANKVPTQSTLPSVTRRMSRLLENPHIRVRPWYEPVARELLASAAASGEIRLIVDGSKVGFGHQLLIVALAFGRRALPVAWTWVRSARGHSSALKQRALLSYVQRLVPGGTRVVVVGDSEFGAVEVLRQLEAWGWYYVLRQKSSHLVSGSHGVPALPQPAVPQPAVPQPAVSQPAVSQPSLASAWQPLHSLIQKPGQRFWFAGVRLTALHAHPTNLLLCWQRGEKEPWLLATNLPTARAALACYKRRMWIEEMFGDFKGHGFDLESTHLQHVLRLARLVLGVALLYIWLIAYGAEVVKRGQRRLVDRNDRRDYSLFRLGCNMLERCLAQGREPFARLLPASLPKLSGS
jgi:hypothetical protein